MALQHLFGPVPSRRLGISLGIDLVPFKICTYDCVYCECGPTTTLTTDRKEWTPTDAILAEIDEYLGSAPNLDYCTYSGSGEPTLHSGLGRITAHLRDSFPEYRIALLTNGSLFWDPDVREMTRGLDVIIPSLDAATSVVFSRINRPHPSLDITKIIGGLADLRTESDAEIWLEVFVVPGCNDTDESLSALNDAITTIDPHRVQINTLDRPGTESWVTAASPETVQRIAAALDHHRVDIPASAVARRTVPSYSADIAETIMETVSRRPCTTDDLSAVLGLHRAEITKYLQDLLDTGRVVAVQGERGTFYRPVRD